MPNDTTIGEPFDARELAGRAGAQPVSQRHLPGDSNVWLFVIGEMVIFSCYFAAYMHDRAHDHALFIQSQAHLSQSLGVINTLILLASSLCVALSVQAARGNDIRNASRFVSLAGGLGVAFAVLKGFEWYAKLSGGVTISSNAFFMHYFMLTGLHVLHVLLGLVFLFFIRRELHRDTPPRLPLMEVGATYWHMVDFIWIIIFALLYLVR